MEIFKIVILSLSALLLFSVGAMRLSNPIKTYMKNSGINLPNDVDLLNEIRGLSAVQMLAGILLVLGIFFEQFAFTSLVVACLIFLGFGLGRMISMSSDGKPNKQLVQGLVFELVFGALNAVCLIQSMP